MQFAALPRRVKHFAERRLRLRRLGTVYDKYATFTMMPREDVAATLAAVEDVAAVPGCVIECGVWRGGMIAAMADVLGPTRPYFLFDSFEGLPPPKDIDGPAAKAWLADPNGPWYFNNCAAEQDFAERAMRLSGATDYQCVKGWFDQTVPAFKPPQPIAILRLDGDWYDSIIVCLRSLAPHLSPDGIVLIDDYWNWDGCSRAVHQFLAETKSAARLDRIYNHVCIIRGLGARGEQ
jgi:hypothetical protein